MPEPFSPSRPGAFAFAILVALALVSTASRFWLVIRPLLAAPPGP